MLADATAGREAEDIGEKHFGVVGIGFQHQLIHLRVFFGVFRQTHFHPRLQQRSEGLRQHHRQAAGRNPVELLSRGASSLAGVVGHQRIDPQQQIDAVVERYRTVHRAPERSIDEVSAADTDRWIQTGQRATGLDRQGYWNVVPVRRPEPDRLASVEVDRDHVQRTIELPEIVGPAHDAVQTVEIFLDLPVVEQPVWNQAADVADDFADAGFCGVPERLTPPVEDQTRETDRPTQIFAERRLQKDLRTKIVRIVAAAQKQVQHFVYFHAVGQPGGQKRA